MKTNDLMDKIIQTFEKEGTVRVCFGDPIDKPELTLIPVAKVQARGGVGSGTAKKPNLPSPSTEAPELYKSSNDSEENPAPPEKPKSTVEGSGAGVDVNVVPLGYIEIKDGEAYFKHIKDHDRIVLACIRYAAFTTFLAARTICILVRLFAKKNHKRS
jgi:uncharacterized spore protein YtfJ